MKDLGLSQSLINSVSGIMKDSSVKIAEQSKTRSEQLTTSKYSNLKPLAKDEYRLATEQSKEPQRRVDDAIRNIFKTSVAEDNAKAADEQAYRERLYAKMGGKAPISESIEEGVMDVVKKAGKKVLNTLGHGSDEDMIKDLQKKAGVAQTGKKPTTVDVEKFKKNTATDVGSLKKRLTKEEQEQEQEQITELKKSTVKSYLLKKHDKMYDKPAKDPKQARKDLDNLNNAHARLVGAKATSEEVQLTAEESARLEEIAKQFDEKQ